MKIVFKKFEILFYQYSRRLIALATCKSSFRHVVRFAFLYSLSFIYCIVCYSTIYSVLTLNATDFQIGFCKVIQQ